ncbi:retinol dehydrogenase 12-like isoform X1 [Mytilus californianus]|uniref:retinol dehydrogenase 12-like isoform X1 n=1 Tax=Mytilus californianus TaxID=6549 RepID=UPI0022456E1E|nr:retinol dehydrogenase 12-like isoform X1 [Mytilus californianus]
MEYLEVMEVVQNFLLGHKVALSIAVGVGVTLVCVRRYAAGVRYTNTTTRLDGKHVIITGANAGIGKETAIDLANRGAKVTIACRDMKRAQDAADDIKQITGNQNIFVKQLNLASLKSVRSFAEDINKNENRLDVLINNAGIMRCPYWKTDDGFEMQFGVNHLGHFLLTNLLLDKLKISAPSRVVTVSSLAHERGKINFDDLNQEKNYDPGSAYSQSKLANVLFSSELAKKLQGTGVTTYSLHPGVINTELSRHVTQSMGWRMLLSVIRPLIKTPNEGAQTTIYCAVDESLSGETGKYYSDCAKKKPSKEALNDENAKRLWKLSEKMVDL